MRVLISIPAYNEEKTIGFVIDEIKKVMRRAKYQYEIVVFDDGSKDKTAQIARKHGAKVLSHKANRGLAQTFRDELENFLKSKAEVMVHTDADGQYPAKYIPELIKKVLDGNDLVLGSRFIWKNRVLSLSKRFGNWAFAKAVSKLINQRITDSTTGFRAFTKKIAKLELINRFTYTQEQIIRAAKEGFKIVEVPITTRRTRKSKLFKTPFHYAVKAWINIFRIYRDFDPLKFFLKIGGCFLVAGFLLGIWVVWKVLTTGSAGGVPRIILSTLLILTGLQIIFFGFLADMIRK